MKEKPHCEKCGHADCPIDGSEPEFTYCDDVCVRCNPAVDPAAWRGT